jgi:hypothetical protein
LAAAERLLGWLIVSTTGFVTTWFDGERICRTYRDVWEDTTTQDALPPALRDATHCAAPSPTAAEHAAAVST